MNKRKKENPRQSLQNKLLYLVYCAPKSRIRDEPGIRAKMCKSLGFTSDGHFYYHLQYLTDAGLIEQNRGYIRATIEGQREFMSSDIPSTFGLVSIGLGIFFLLWYPLNKLGYLNADGIIGAGVAIIFMGFMLRLQGKKDEPKLPKEARDFLKELKKKR